MGVILWSRSEEVTTQLNNQTKNKHIMKAFAPVLMALVAGAKAEADPQYLTTYGGLYGGVRSVIPSTYGYAYNPYNRVLSTSKREAEAEPEADAQLLYTNRFGYAGLGYNTWGSYGAYTPYNRVVALGKREAEADPALIYNTNVWGASPYAYSAGYPWASSVYGINRWY